MRLAENVLAETYAGYGIQQRVTEVLLQYVNALPQAPEVARILNLSERSLRRQLHASGTSFGALADQVRLKLACAYLSELPVRDVAELLGYHDASTFRRAFRRLVGVTPAQFIRSSSR
ncbi:MAG: helix-turn-helix transcriptional regulator [Betaproteobacteria bacterium]|nr:helix-turn-helix transcriptional regulator [Betaproteobacteria bacterium]